MNKNDVTLFTINDNDNIEGFPRLLINDNKVSNDDYKYRNE